MRCVGCWDQNCATQGDEALPSTSCGAHSGTCRGPRSGAGDGDGGDPGGGGDSRRNRGGSMRPRLRGGRGVAQSPNVLAFF